MYGVRYYEMGQVKYEAGECITDQVASFIKIEEVTETTYKHYSCFFIFCDDGETPIREFNEDTEHFVKMDCDTGVILGVPRY